LKVSVESDLQMKTCKNRTCSDGESLFRNKRNCESFHDTRAKFLSKVAFSSYCQKQTFKCVITFMVSVRIRVILVAVV